jgi:hypothetical protein
LALATAILSVPLISGCAWSIGDKGEATVHPTRGQELIDLKRAKDQGAMTDAEYEAQRNKVIGK